MKKIYYLTPEIDVTTISVENGIAITNVDTILIDDWQTGGETVDF